ncbi:MAG: WD40 repeat domain-containing protein, partial [Planctomycetes bacterium]|nr:WD40 repeat domain-containing protein [Planctomycetota bacterium]
RRLAVAVLLLGILGVSLLLGGLGYLFGPAVYRIATNRGQLVIETTDPDVEVTVKQGGQEVKIVDLRTHKEVTLQAGTYQLELTQGKEGLMLSTNQFTLERGGQQIVKVWLESPTAVSVQAPPAKAADEVRRFEGHTGPVKSVAFSPDGRYVLSGSGWPDGDKTIRLWDVASGKELRRFGGHTEEVESVAFSPDGRRAVTGGDRSVTGGDRNVHLWDVESGKETGALEGHTGGVTSVAWSSDSRRILTGALDPTLRLWDPVTGKEVLRLETGVWSESVALSPDGRQALSGGRDNIVRLWDLGTGKEVRRLEGHTGELYSVAFSPDGRQALSGGADKTIRLWDLATGKEVRRFEGHTDRVACLAFSPDGRRALSASWDKTVRLWDVDSGRELHRFEGHRDYAECVAFSPDGRYALSGGGGESKDGRNWQAGSDFALRLWRLPETTQPPEPKLLYALPCLDRQQGVPANIDQTGISSDGRLFFGAGDAGPTGTIRVWDLATGKQVQEFVPGNAFGYSLAQFIPGGLYLIASYAQEKDLYLWEIATGKVVRKFVGHTGNLPVFAVSPDGKRILSWDEAWDKDRTIRLWDVETGKELRKLEGHTDRTAGVFSPDGKQVLTFSLDKTLRLWDVESGQELQRLAGHSEACRGCFSPDGQQVLSWSDDHTIRLWDLASGQEIRRFEGLKAKVYHAEFVAGGRLVVAMPSAPPDDKKLWIWETASGKLANEIDYGQYGEDGWSITASPDGRLALVSVAADASVRVLDLATGKETHRYDGCPKARAFSFSRDGTLAVAGSFRAGLYVFRLPLPEKAGH